MNTLDYYNRNAEAYALQTWALNMADWYTDFEKCLKPGAHILDLGCGGGRDSRHFMEKGFSVVPVDGSPEMCRAAEAYTGVPVRCVKFSELDYKEEFDGIWANASLLHVPKEEYGAVIKKVERAMKPDAVLYGSFKHGEGERDIEGRHFSFYNEGDLDGLTNLRLIKYWISDDLRPDHPEKWLCTLWRKQVDMT